MKNGDWDSPLARSLAWIRKTFVQQIPREATKWLIMPGIAICTLILAGCPPLTEDPTPLPAPVALYTAADSSTSISIDWTTINEAEGYNIYRSDTENGGFTKINASVVAFPPYLDTGLTPDTIYWYKVIALKAGHEQTLSAAFSGLTNLSVPGNIGIVAIAPIELEVNWDPVNGAEGYNIYRSDTSGGFFAKLNLLAFPDTNYTDSGLEIDASYWYRVAAVRWNAEQDRSNPVNGVTMLGPPENTAVSYLTESSLRVSWDPLPGAGTYNVHRGDTQLGPFAQVNSAPVNGTSYDDSGLTADTLYWYKVVALRDGAEQTPGDPSRGITAQVWAKSYGGSADESFKSIWPTSDGGFLVAGSSYSFSTSRVTWLVKIDAGGAIEWQRRYAGVIANSAMETSDGGFIVATQVMGSYRRYNFWVMKLSSSGSVSWCRYFTAPVHRDYITTHIEQTSEGGYLLVGSSGGTVVAKLRSDGALSWSKKFGGSLDGASTVRQTPDGGYIAVGSTRSYGSGQSDCWLVKLDASGDISWQKAYGGTGSDSGHSIEPTADGGYVIAGCLSGTYGQQSWVLKLDVAGTIEWQKVYSGSNGTHVRCIRQTSGGGYILSGSTGSAGLGRDDFWLAKLKANGEIDWQVAYGGGRDDIPTSVHEIADGGYVIAGTTESFGDRDTDVWVIRVPDSGILESAEIGAITAVTVGDGDAVVTDTTASISDAELRSWSTSTSPSDTSAVVSTQYP